MRQLPYKSDSELLNAVIQASQGHPDTSLDTQWAKDIAELRRRLILLARVVRSILVKHTGIERVRVPGAAISVSCVPGKLGGASLPVIVGIEESEILVRSYGDAILRIPLAWLSLTTTDQAKLVKSDVFAIKRYLSSQEVKGRGLPVEKLVENWVDVISSSAEENPILGSTSLIDFIATNSKQKSSKKYKAPAITDGMIQRINDETAGDDGSSELEWFRNRLAHMCSIVRNVAGRHGVAFDYNQTSLVSVAYGNPEIVGATEDAIFVSVETMNTVDVLRCPACTNPRWHDEHVEEGHFFPENVEPERYLRISVSIPVKLFELSDSELEDASERLVTNIKDAEQKYVEEMRQRLDRIDAARRKLADAQSEYDALSRAAVLYREHAGRNKLFRVTHLGATNWEGNDDVTLPVVML